MHARPRPADQRRSLAAVAAVTAAGIATLASAATALAAPSSPTAHARHQTASIGVDWKLVAIVAAVLVLAFADWLVIHRRRRLAARPRRQVPRALLFLLAPIYRYDRGRDAWILRAVGNRVGPVLRPTGYRAAALVPQATDDDLPAPSFPNTEAQPQTPEPFNRPPASRRRARRTSRAAANRQDQEREPPPLSLRRPPD
jgi:hypothetical protein